MRTRKMKMIDYGMTDEQKKCALSEIRSASKEKMVTLLNICIEAVPIGIEIYVYMNLANGWSYDELNRIKYVPIGKDDFYGYCRRVIAMYYSQLHDKCADQQC